MYKQREIVLVPFPYSDLSNTKKRPVLVISTNNYNDHLDDILVCVITSNQFADQYSVELTNEDLEIGLLPEKSVVKVHRLFTIHNSKVIKKFSVVKPSYFARLEKLLAELINQD